MNHIISFDTGMGKYAAGRLQKDQDRIDNDQKGIGFSGLKKGQLITGVVVAAGKQVTLDFEGARVSTSADVMQGATLGEVKTFEVIKVNEYELGLKLIKTFNSSNHTLLSNVRVEQDHQSIMAKKIADNASDKQEELRERKSRMDKIASSMTEEDYRKLEKEGFPVETCTIDGLFHAVNRIKERTDKNHTKKDQKQNTYSLKEIKSRLKEENLPVTQENMSKVMTALELSDTVTQMDDKTMKYLMGQELSPTIENIYKAYYSGNTERKEKTIGLSDEEWRNLKDQVVTVIQEAGYEINKENLKDARWLIENKLPLTKQSFQYKKELEQIRNESNQSIVMDKIIDGMKNGISPSNVTLEVDVTGGYDKLISDIGSIGNEAITTAIQNGEELTIRNLVSIQENIPKRTHEDANQEESINGEDRVDEIDPGNENTYEEIRARRQLEEIRLKMTLEAASRLEKKGFSIETERLEKVVEELRELENNYYRQLLKEADLEATEKQLELLKNTSTNVHRLIETSCYVLGSTIAERANVTIPGLVKEGERLQAVLKKAGETYETFFTMPNREYGDSIQKAFANMDTLLSELNIENSEQNQRAVRILGYNHMEINQESIQRVKAYDLEVRTLIQNLHPAVTVRLIKDGINPLDMPISTLNKTIDRMKEEQGISSEEKFANYLYKMERNRSITERERSAYIGIYRLLHSIEKSDGAALGSVIKSGREITLEHLLTAVRTGRKGFMDTVVNDEFGALESKTYDGVTITDQLEAVFGNKDDNFGNGQQTDESMEQTEYYDRLLKLVSEEIAADKLPLLSSGRGIWDTIKDMPIEQLYEQLNQMEETKEFQDELYAGKVQELREILKNSDQAVRFLNDFKIPSTPMNMMLANHILSNGESLYKKLMKLKKENIIENSDSSLKEISEITDTLIDKKSINETFERLEQNVKVAVEQAAEQLMDGISIDSLEKMDGGTSDPVKDMINSGTGTIDSRRLTELRSINSQITFLKNLASREFYQVPIETEQGITNLNLTIIRGTKETGKVTVSVQSEKLGNIKADFTLKKDTLKGFISCDSRYGLEELKNNSDIIEKAAMESGVALKELHFGFIMRETENYSYQNSENEVDDNSVSRESERILYRIAKATVQVVRASEKSSN